MSVIKVKSGQSLSAGRKRAQAMANRTGRSVEVHRQELDREARGGRVRYVWVFDDVMSPQTSNPRRKNPTKAERAVKAQKASAKRRVAVALKNFLTKANPAGKYAGAKMQRNKGGSITIIPIKLRRAR